MSIKQQATKGIMWNAIERFSTQGIQFVLTIIIARILSPADYGLVAMLSVFMAIAQTFIDSGLSNALIQKQDRTEVDYCTTFYLNIAISVFFYILLFIFAPNISAFYNQPELTKLARVYFILLITNSFAVVHIARFTINLDFRVLALSSLLSVISGGSLGIWMAYNGYGVWALVFQPLLGSIVWLCSLWIFARWIPRRRISYQSFKVLFGFGSKLLFSSLLNTLYTNMYSLVIGKYFQISTLGYFNRAFTLGQFPVQNFSNIVQKVLYPIQCRFQNDDRVFRQIFITYLCISSFILFPIMIGILVLATPIVTLLLTEKWLPVVPLLQIICLAFMWLPIMQANVSVLDAKGRSDYHLQSEIIKKILAVIILLCTLPFGIKFVCIGLVFYSFVDIIIIILYSRKLVFVGYIEQMKLLFPKLLLSGIMGGCVWWVISCIQSSVFQLIVGSIVGLIIYFLLAYLLQFKELKILYILLVKKELTGIVE